MHDKQFIIHSNRVHIYIQPCFFYQCLYFLLHRPFLYNLKKIKQMIIYLDFVSQGEEGEGKKSILDMDPEVQAMMEMTGKTLHSQGLREPEEDQDQ